MITTLAALVLSSGLVLTRELLASPAAGATGASRRSSREFGFGTRAGSGAGNGAGTGATVAAAAEQAAETYASSPRSLSARLRAVVQASRGTPGSQAAQAMFDAQEPMPVGVPVGAIEEFAHNLHHVGVAGSQMGFFAAASDLDSGGVAVRFGRALARHARVVLVGLGADAAIREISSDPSTPGLAELAAGTASFADIITKDRASALNLIAAGAGAERSSLLAAPSMSRNFTALAHAYPHLVIDGGFVGGPDMPALARIAPHAVLLVEAASGQATAKAREALIEAGFDNVTLLVVDRGATSAPIVAPPIPAAAA